MYHFQYILGSANDLCETKGTFVWDKDDHFYFFCAGKHQNLGCQECPAKDLFYSIHCSACLVRDDVINKRCPPPVTVTGPPDLCKTHYNVYIFNILWIISNFAHFNYL